MSRLLSFYFFNNKRGPADPLFHNIILFENLFKPRQRRLAVDMLLTSSVLSTTSKQCFEKPMTSFLVCSLIFIEYKTLYYQLYLFYPKT